MNLEQAGIKIPLNYQECVKNIFMKVHVTVKGKRRAELRLRFSRPFFLLAAKIAGFGGIEVLKTNGGNE